uniref:Uncharacterized protein n=1 Tax=Arundo donax TaxID=35708 RepID=A0A0A8Z2F4_ARUDO
MCFFLELYNHLKMRVVYVRIYPEEALEDRLDNITEVRRERSSKLLREYGFIVELGFYPVHQVLHIFWCRYLNWPLDLDTISPSVLVLWSS